MLEITMSQCCADLGLRKRHANLQPQRNSASRKSRATSATSSQHRFLCCNSPSTNELGVAPSGSGERFIWHAGQTRSEGYQHFGLAERPQYGFTASTASEPVGPKFVRITDLLDGRIDWETVPFCECTEPEKYLLRDDDLLFAHTGATIDWQDAFASRSACKPRPLN